MDNFECNWKLLNHNIIIEWQDLYILPIKYIIIITSNPVTSQYFLAGLSDGGASIERSKLLLFFTIKCWIINLNLSFYIIKFSSRSIYYSLEIK